MAESDSTFVALILIAIVAIAGLGLSLASFGTDRSLGNMMGGGGMMSGTGGPTAPGAFEWAVLVLSLANFVVVIVLLLRARGPGTPQVVPFMPASPPAAAVVEPRAETAAPAAVPTPAPDSAVPEPTLVKLLEEDERRMYLEIRSHGGEMLQRDLVALGMFSKAKVTRVLDKLEAKGLVVREAHGMTNRVRLTAGSARQAP